MDWSQLGIWVAIGLGSIVVYEIIRSIIAVSWKRAQERRVDRFLRANKIPHDAFRHTHRVVVKELVMADAGLAAAMEDAAREAGEPVGETRARVRAWLDEIVPQFNLLAYYRVGYRLGRLFAYALYHVRLDKKSWERAQRKLPKDACVILVSNHRSNADFVVTGFMISRSVQVSYAVGEWARVWPLEHLFKSFGSYFVRRGERDPLYHRTLEAYLNLVTKQGVTQAMFPEGGLSRDGGLRPVKLGLLDMMTRAKLDPAFTKPLVFVPVGINFDRVLEDEVLVSEHLGHHPYRQRGIGQKLQRLGALTWRVLVSGPIQLGRFMAKRMKKHGIAAIHFGDPIVFDDWYAGQKPFLDQADRHKRWGRLRPFAEELLARIGDVVPATPATLTCAAVARVGQKRMEVGVDRGTIVLAMRQVVDELRARGTPLAVDSPYESKTVRGGNDEVAEMSRDLDVGDALADIIARALDVTEKRGVLRCVGDTYVTLPGRWPLVEYYANSLNVAAPASPS